MRQFTGRSGETWSVDETAQLGDVGGYGRVCRGIASNGDVVAVKIVALASTSEEKNRLRERELEIGGKLDGISPRPQYLLLRLDYAVVGNDLFIVMPLAGESLSDYLDRHGVIGEDEAVRILQDIARGLEELANVAILHRDLKPGNVLWSGDRWKLSDFGMARDLMDATATFTFTGLGTVPYMAPEVWNNEQLTAKADLYALGVAAFEMLTGGWPFVGSETGDFRHQHLHETPELPTNIGARMKLLLAQLLSKDPAARPQDARRVVETLNRINSRLDTAQERLVDARSVALARRNQMVTEQAAFETKQERIKDDRIQALVELDAILLDASSIAQEALDDVYLNRSRNYPVLSAGGVALLIETAEYPVDEELVDHSPLAHAAAIQVLQRGEDGGQPRRVGLTVANLACRQENGRFVWYWWSTRYVRELLDPEKSEQEVSWVGLPADKVLIKNIRDMWNSPTTRSGLLDVEYILGLLTDAIAEYEV